MPGVLRRLLRALPDYWVHARRGLLQRPTGAEALPVVVQGVVRERGRVLLVVRVDLRGWELPGGHVMPGEEHEAALVREIREETGLEVEVEGLRGEYRRTGFHPHLARVFACRARGGRLRTSKETPRVAWWDPARLPDTLFPWFRRPLEDVLATDAEVVRRDEHQGIAAIWAGARIDLRMRLSDDRAGGGDVAGGEGPGS